MFQDPYDWMRHYTWFPRSVMLCNWITSILLLPTPFSRECFDAVYNEATKYPHGLKKHWCCSRRNHGSFWKRFNDSLVVSGNEIRSQDKVLPFTSGLGGISFMMVSITPAILWQTVSTNIVFMSCSVRSITLVVAFQRVMMLGVVLVFWLLASLVQKQCWSLWIV